VDGLRLALRYEGPLTRLTCTGELTPSTVHSFNRALRKAVCTDPRELVIDTTGVGIITFEGIICLFLVSRWCNASETVLRVEPGPIVADALETAGFSWLGTTETALDLLVVAKSPAHRGPISSRRSHPR
jgi:anti-anti-sigma regulatory factor